MSFLLLGQTGLVGPNLRHIGLLFLFFQEEKLGSWGGQFYHCWLIGFHSRMFPWDTWWRIWQLLYVQATGSSDNVPAYLLLWRDLVGCLGLAKVTTQRNCEVLLLTFSFLYWEFHMLNLINWASWSIWCWIRRSWVTLETCLLVRFSENACCDRCTFMASSVSRYWDLMPRKYYTVSMKSTLVSFPNLFSITFSTSSLSLKYMKLSTYRPKYYNGDCPGMMWPVK